MAKDFHSSGRVHYHTPNTGEGEANFSPELLQSMLPPKFRQNPQAASKSNEAQEGPPDMPLLHMGTRDRIHDAQMMPFHTINDERAGYLPEWEISGSLPHSEYHTYPGLIQIGSEDDEVGHLGHPLAC